MNRFLHTVDRIIIVDGDDVRRAPMAAALLKKFANEHPLFRLWQTDVDSAGAGKTKQDAHPDAKAIKAMLNKEIDISSHKSKCTSLADIARASIVFAITNHHAKFLRETVCQEYPSLRTRIVLLMDYIGKPGEEFPALLGAKAAEYHQFTDQVESLLLAIAEKLRQDTVSPLLVKGTGLGYGWAKGRVRVVGSTEDADQVEKGDVVVCTTNHVRAFFGRGVEAAAAFVSTSGSESFELSQLSHELQVPCVSDAYHATEVLRNGDFVLVDGAGGTVYGEPAPPLTFPELMKKYGLKPKTNLPGPGA
jgi:protein-tyrosine-phosphatase/phosphohistidine swiveling domain-containing protein